jgi:hypothetical protein
VSVSGDGSSWANAYKELRDALIAVRTNTAITRINIAKGTYKPTDDNNYDSAFCIYRGGIKIYGGYPSGGGSRNVNANQVNLSGLNDYLNISVHVLIVAGLPEGADSVVFDGLSITRGVAAAGSYSHEYNGQQIYGYTGAGLCLQNNWNGTQIVVKNCTFTKNFANTGAAIYSYSTGFLFVDNCGFDSNIGAGGPTAGINSYGTGLYNYQTFEH